MIPFQTILKILVFQSVLIWLSWCSLSYYVHQQDKFTTASPDNNPKSAKKHNFSATIVEVHCILHQSIKDIWMLLTGDLREEANIFLAHGTSINRERGGVTVTANSTKNCTDTTAKINSYEGTVVNDKNGSYISKPLGSDEILKIILSTSNLNVLDSTLLSSIDLLKERRAHLCWHKHSTFLEHLLNVHHILRLWGQSKTMGRVGLFHSAYSNSYVNLALLDPNNTTEREILQGTIGLEAEELVYLYCNINRQIVVVDTLLKTGTIPADGLRVPHLRDSSKEVYLSPMFLQTLLIFTMADIADQYFGWQDELFPNDSSMLKTKTSSTSTGGTSSERHNPQALWPGESRPGLWMHYVSQLCAVVSSYQESYYQTSNSSNNSTSTEDIVSIPPVFNKCTVTLSEANERLARDLYWEVMNSDHITLSHEYASTNEASMEEAKKKQNEAMISKLESAVRGNPWIFEPLVTLGQLYMYEDKFDDAIQILERALKLQGQWGTAWDKRMSFGAWRAWTKVLKQRAVEHISWPTNSWDVNNFGLVLDD